MSHKWFKLVSLGNQKESKEDKRKYIPSSSANLSLSMWLSFSKIPFIAMIVTITVIPRINN